MLFSDVRMVNINKLILNLICTVCYNYLTLIFPMVRLNFVFIEWFKYITIGQNNIFSIA